MAELYENADKSVTSGTISAPDLSSGTLKPRCKSIKDAKQARAIIASLKESARERNLKNARIMAKYNSEKPYTQSQLDAEGLGWKSNFTTKPLPMLIDKVAPRFVKTIEGVKYLTNSQLPETYPAAAVKTEAFRREISAVVRGKPGWSNFISEMAQENALFGFTAVACLDEFSWMPKHFRQDCFFVPTGTKQEAHSSQIIVLSETFLVHELFELISDRQAAEASGWDIENTVNAVNSAIPESRRCKDTSWERVYEDLERESNVGLSHESGALTVTVDHLLAVEISGKVTHYILAQEAPKNARWSGSSSDGGSQDERGTLFEREDRFDSMADAASFFCFETGNGKLQGSKGIGRQIYSMAAMLDRARNEVVDRLNLAGKIIVQADDKALKRFKMSVVGNVVLIGQGYNISERKIESAVEEFLKMDEFLTKLLDQMAGATTPKAFEGERVTKAAVELFAAREEESRDNIIGRFLGQFATMMTLMQRRLCNKDTSEDDAKAMQERLLKVMTREELDILAKQPVAETVKDFTAEERQQIAIIATEAKGNPLYNQREVERRKLTAQISEEFADAVLLPDEDPTVKAEQTRLQQMELLLLIGQATSVEVSPRDNHLVHLQVMAPAMEAAAKESVTKGAQGLEVLQALANHANAHFKSAEAAGTNKDALKPIGEFLNKLNTAIEQMNQHEQEVVPATMQAAQTGAAPQV